MRLCRLLPLLAFALAGGFARAQAVVQGDDDRYEATVAGFRLSTGPDGRRHADVTLRLHNRGADPLSLSCREADIAAVDDRGFRYDGTIQGAVVSDDAVAKGQAFVLRPGATETALLRLATPEPPKKRPGTLFRVDLPFAQVWRDGEGVATFGPSRPLRLSGLAAAAYAPDPDAAERSGSRVIAGPFAARIARAALGPSPEDSGDRLDLTIEVTNPGPNTIYVGEGGFIGAVTDPFGRGVGWPGEGYMDSRVTIANPVLDTRGISGFSLAPGESRSFRAECWRGNATIPAGTVLGVYFGLSTIKEGFDGKYVRDQDYVLSFPDVRPTARPTEPKGRGMHDQAMRACLSSPPCPSPRG